MPPESDFRQFRSFFERLFPALHYLAFDQCVSFAQAFERYELQTEKPRSTQKLRRLVSKTLNSLASDIHSELPPIGLQKESRKAALPLPHWLGDLRNPCLADELKAAPDLEIDPRALPGPVASSARPLMREEDRFRHTQVVGAYEREWAKHRLWAEQQPPLEIWSHPNARTLDDASSTREQIEFLIASLHLSEICLRLYSSSSAEDRNAASTFQKQMPLDSAVHAPRKDVIEPDATFERSGQTVVVFLPSPLQMPTLEDLVRFFVELGPACAKQDVYYEVWWPGLFTNDHLERFDRLG